MAFDDLPDPERPDPDGPLPPDDRLWRHPSELADGTPPPAAWATPVPAPAPRRAVAAAALAGACLTGAAVAVGVMWLARPTKVVVREPKANAMPVTTAVYSAAGISSDELASTMAPSLVTVSASRSGTWATGTGIWLDDRGSIAVASPMVTGADSVLVTVQHGVPVAAKAIASDPVTGITVLSVRSTKGTPLASAPTEARAGQTVAIIGAASRSSLGAVRQRVVTATVSAVGVRTTVDPLVIHDALQLDRAIPADALGSVAVDVTGKVVGIVIAGSGDDEMAMLIPAGEALAAARDLRDDGTVRRAWLGVRAVDLGPSAAELYGVPGGALLTKVAPGSPAASAGLAADDVITEVDGHTITGASDLVVALRAWKPGERVSVTWHRGPHADSADVTLGG